MNLQDAINLALAQARTEEKHEDYERVTTKATEYLRLITGEEVDKLLIQFIQREDAAMFEQRKRLTQSITPAVASSLMKPFYKVSRNDKVRKRFDFKLPEKNETVNDMLGGFFGSKKKKSKGLDYWLKTRFVELSFTDPNAWIVIEWDNPDPAKAPQPKPFELSSEEVLNFLIKNEDTHWIHAKKAISFDKVEQDGTVKKVDGVKYMLYETDYTIVSKQVDKEYLKKEGFVAGANQLFQEINGKDFLMTVYTPNLGFAPVFRIGYIGDPWTKRRTCIAPYEPALAFFRKSIKTVSELDISMTLHAFPQKLQYIERCLGATKTDKCHQGRTTGGKVCTACNGAGYKVHSTGQDAILLPMPEDKTEMIELDKLLVYKTPPIELIKFQDEYTKGLKEEAHLAVFNSTAMLNPVIEKTATEADNNMQGIYDTLEPFSEKVSEIWKEIVYIFGAIAAVTNLDEADIVHIFPPDFKLKTANNLLSDLKLANESGAPSFLRDALNRDLAEITYAGDELSLIKYRVRHKFFPFNGKTPDEIATLISSEFISKFTKVLYSNYEAIFTDIEIENPGFYLMDSHAKQWTILSEKVQEYIDELEEPAVKIDFGNNPDPGTGEQGDDNPDPNPGEEEQEEEEV